MASLALVEKHHPANQSISLWLLLFISSNVISKIGRPRQHPDCLSQVFYQNGDKTDQSTSLGKQARLGYAKTTNTSRVPRRFKAPMKRPLTKH